MLALIAAILASILFNVSPVLQAIDARSSSPALSFRLTLLLYLVQRPLWVLGSVAGVVGVILELYGLARLQLAFVQPLMAGGVMVMPLAARVFLGESLSPRWFLGSACIVGGVAALGAALPPAAPASGLPGEPLVILLTLAAIVVYLLVREIRAPALLGIVAGFGFTGSAIFAKLVAVSFSLFHFLELAPVLAAFACIGFLAEMSAMQRTSPTTIAPTILALTTVLPILFGHFVLGERWPHLALTFLGFALTVLPALWFVAHYSLDAVTSKPAEPPMRISAEG